MKVEELEAELAEMQESRKSWEGQQAKASAILKECATQILIHDGNIERIKIWIKKLTKPTEEVSEQSTETPNPPPFPRKRRR